MLYLMYFDDNTKRTPAEKIAAAIDAYRARFGAAPTVVLTNENERVAVAGVEVRSEGYIRKSNFWIGMVEA